MYSSTFILFSRTIFCSVKRGSFPIRPVRKQCVMGYKKVTNQIRTTFCTRSTLPIPCDAVTSLESGKLQTNIVPTELRTSFVFVEKTDWRWFAMDWSQISIVYRYYLHEHRVCEQNVLKCIRSFRFAHGTVLAQKIKGSM